MRKSVLDFLGAAAVRVLRFWPLLSGRLARETLINARPSRSPGSVLLLPIAGLAR